MPAIAVLLCCGVGLSAAPFPRLPCEGVPFPGYTAIGEPPAVQVWNESALKGWTPASCTGWGAVAFMSVVALGGSFYHQGGVDDLLSRVGAISARRGIRYWSTTDKGWRDLITDAAALDGPDPTRRRPDFSPAEMATGADLYFVQVDSRSPGPVVFRMRIRASQPRHIMVETENVTPVKWLFVTLFPPGTLKAAYWMEYQTTGVWGLYSLSGMTEGASRLAGGHEASYVNRAAAIYRYLLHVPTDGEPPLAR
ncbi:MAG TPA: DUF6675 family protein [Thermoanaerobaculia bacterium]|nr:DUF6675 family protein [Thermoanaerobaculia bacterium]